jgi:hypothetical protein
VRSSACRLALNILLPSLVLLTGCASYAPSLVRLNPSGPAVKKAVNGHLTVYVEEYATQEKSERAFDTSLAAEGVLPILVGLENNGQESYELKLSDFSVRGEKPLRALTPEEAAAKAYRSAVGRVLGWSLIVPIVTILVVAAVSALHTNKVNKQIGRDFAAKAFPDEPVMPHKEQSGFLFFELENGRKDLTGLILDVAVKTGAAAEIVTVSVPLPEASFTTARKASREDVEQSIPRELTNRHAS